MCEEVNGLSIGQTGQTVIVSTTQGCICRSDQQKDGKCDYDYHVKYLCCVDEPKCPEGQTGEWTTWLDRDNTGGYGDYETLPDLI